MLATEVELVLAAIALHTYRYGEDLETYMGIAKSLRGFMEECDIRDAAIVPKNWMQPILDALETYFIEREDEDILEQCYVIGFRFGEVRRNRK